MKGFRTSLCLMGFVCLAAAAAADLTISVEVGGDNFVRGDSIAPVRVVLLNDDADREGVVHVSFPSLTGEGTRGYRRVPLPPESRKSVVVYLPVPFEGTDAVIVRYVNRRGKAVTTVKQPVRMLPRDLPAVGYVGRAPADLPEQEVDNGDVYKLVRLTVGQIPDRCEGLEMFDAIIISPPPYLPVDALRTAALRAWVLRGGTLIADTSQRTEAFRTGSFRELLPFTPQGTEQASLSLFGGDALFARGRVRFGKVLLESDGYPLAIQAPYGLGTVTALAIGPDQPAFTHWDGAGEFWASLLGDLDLKPREGGLSGLEGQKTVLTQLVEGEQQTGLRLSVVLILTALYALAVGPGDYFLIKRLGRPKLTWITFPLIVAVFTVASYAGAKAWVGGELSTLNAERLLMFPDQNVTLRYDLASVFAPAAKDYTVGGAGGGLKQPLRSYVMPTNPVEMDNDAETVIQRIPIWQRRFYGASHTLEDEPLIDLAVREEEGALVATVSNGSAMDLRGVSIVYGDRVWWAGNVEPSETATVELAANKGQPLHRRGFQLFSGLSPSVDRRWAHGREFDARPALERGALILVASEPGAAPCRLVVDGQEVDGKGNRTIVVITYPDR